MKIVKWTHGLESPGTNRQKQRYPAFGDDFNEKPQEECLRLWDEAEQVVIESIRRNGFKFGGFYHQSGEYGMPLFDNGTVFFASLRQWGALMYKAWEPEGKDPYGYALYAWDYEVGECKYPESETDFLQPCEAGNIGNEDMA